jgi:hypothetical protein
LPIVGAGGDPTVEPDPTSEPTATPSPTSLAEIKQLPRNGNFEEGDVAWDTNSLHPGTITSTTVVTPYLGFWMVQWQNGYEAANYISQTMTLPTTASWLTFRLQAVVPPNEVCKRPQGNNGDMFVVIFTVNGEGHLLFYRDTGASCYFSRNQWSTMTLDISAYAGQTGSLFIWWGSGMGEGARYIVIDDVSISSEPPVPSPTPMPSPTPSMEICTVPNFKDLSITGTTAQTTWIDAGFTGGLTKHDHNSSSAILSQSLEAGSRQLCSSSITVHDHSVDQ